MQSTLFVGLYRATPEGFPTTSIALASSILRVNASDNPGYVTVGLPATFTVDISTAPTSVFALVFQPANALSWYEAVNVGGQTPASGLGQAVSSFSAADSSSSWVANAGFSSVWLGGQKTICSPSPSQTMSQSQSSSRSQTLTASLTQTGSQSRTVTRSPSQTQSKSLTQTNSQTTTRTSTGTGSGAATSSQTQSRTLSSTRSQSPSASQSQSRSINATPTPTLTMSATGTRTGSRTATKSQTPSSTSTSSQSKSMTRSKSPTGTRSQTRSRTASLSASSAATVSQTPSPSVTGHPIQPVWSNTRSFVSGGAVGADFPLQDGVNAAASLASAAFYGVAWRLFETDPDCGPGTYAISSLRLGLSRSATVASGFVSFLVALYFNDPTSFLPIQPPIARASMVRSINAEGAASYIDLPLTSFFIDSTTSEPATMSYTIAFQASEALQWAAPTDGVALHVPAAGFGYTFGLVSSLDGATWSADNASSIFGGVELMAAKTVCSVTRTQSASLSWSSTSSPSVTQSQSQSSSVSISPSQSQSPSETQSATPSQSRSESLSSTPSASASQTRTASGSATRTTTATATGHPVQAVFDNTQDSALEIDAASYVLLAGGVVSGWLGVSWTFPEADLTCKSFV